MDAERICLTCGEVKSIKDFPQYRKKFAQKCNECKKNSKTRLFKDGNFNPNQPAGFNWLLGYATIHDKPTYNYSLYSIGKLDKKN